MQIETTKLPDVLIITPRVFKDQRGFFFESYNQEKFRSHGIDTVFVQDNHSKSARNTLRGLHFQLPPAAQVKLVRVVRGAIWDVAVDIRVGSPTFGRWVGVELSAENFRQIYIPTGFAHGFCVLSDEAEVLYKTTDYYAPEMGEELCRVFVTVHEPVDPALLADIKLETNRLEELFATDGRRRVNIDPGLMALSRFVLASTKDSSHRVPLRDGIYAEITLV